MRMPLCERNALEAVLINTAGGLTGGDTLTWAVDAAPGTRLVVTTQACEKIYRADAGSPAALVSGIIRAGDGAFVAWLPQETILFDRSALMRSLDADLAPGAELLVIEPLVFGRRRMGERVENGFFRDRWRIRQGGNLLHAEDTRFDGAIRTLADRPAVLNGAGALATVLFVSPRAEACLSQARAIIGDAGSASFWNGKFLARLVAGDSHALRQILMPLATLLNGRADLPKVWSL